MMNNLLKFSAIYFLLCNIACSQIKKEEPTTLKSEKEMNTDALPNLQRRMYAIQLNVPGSFEFYVNDIPARIENTGSMHNASVDINAYMLKSGKYKFKLQVFPQGEDIKEGISPETAERIKVSLNAYERNTESFPFAKKDSFVHIVDFPTPKINKPVPFIIVEGEFEVELPYNLEGWGKSEDLTKIDKKQLESEVKEYYENLRTILNNGDGQAYLTKWKKYDNELKKFEYTPEGSLSKADSDLIESIKTKAKGEMLPIENYKMAIYAQGKMVRLERLPTVEINNYKANVKGRSPLLRKGKQGGVGNYPILLHKPKGSNSFEIIRK